MSSFLIETLRVTKTLTQSLGARPLRQFLNRLNSMSDAMVRKTIQQSYAFLPHTAKNSETAKNFEMFVLSARSAVNALTDSASEQTLKATMQQVADHANESMQIIDREKFKVLGPDDHNWATIKVLDDIWKRNLELGRIEDLQDVEGADVHGLALGAGASRPRFSRKDAREFVRVMKEARKQRGGDFLLQKYVENLLEDAAFQRVSHLPVALERKLYYDITRSVLQILELALTKLHNFDIVGHSVQVEFSLASQAEAAKTGQHVTKPLRHWTRINESRVEMVIQQIMQDHRDMRKYEKLVPIIETQFITTVAQVSMRLVTDLFCDERIKIRVLGHNLRWNFDPMSTDAIERMFQNRTSERARVNTEAIALFVDELLNDEELNILWLPDVIESEIYKHALTTVIAMLEDVLASLEITVLGLQFRFSLISAILKNDPFRAVNNNLANTAKIGPAEGTADGGGNYSSMPGNTSSAFGSTTSGAARTSATGVDSTSVPIAAAGTGTATPGQHLDHLAAAPASPASNPQLTLYTTHAELQDRLKAIYKETALLENALAEKTGTFQKSKGRQDTTRAAFFSEGPLGDEEFGLRKKQSAVYDPATGEILAPAVDPEEQPSSEVQNVSSSLADRSKLEFQKLAAQESKLARFLQVRTTLKDIDIGIVYDMMKDVETYPTWMPMCTKGTKLSDQQVLVGFGIDTKTLLGTLGDDVKYDLVLSPPARSSSTSSGLRTSSSTSSEEVDVGGAPDQVVSASSSKKTNHDLEARVVSDTGKNGFAYGDRLVYDWVFFSSGETRETEVALNLFLQVNSVLYLPIWDALQKVLTDQMLQAFEKEAERRSAAAKRSAASSTEGTASKGASKDFVSSEVEETERAVSSAGMKEDAASVVAETRGSTEGEAQVESSTQKKDTSATDGSDHLPTDGLKEPSSGTKKKAPAKNAKAAQGNKKTIK
ncbi:unnamed protein product [Amoebophrya sp. A120]|nr:unnamed protein product [Amoebophrya sp. A120]|eukprot:GSA120T00006218001.1